MMTRKALFPLALCLCALAAVLSGCAGDPPIRVFLTPSASQMIDQGQTLAVAATAPADTTNSGVNWSISPAGAGKLTNVTTTSVVYNAPANVASPTTVTLTAASVKSPSRTSSLSITVEPPPTIPAVSLPSGNEGAPYKATVTAKGGIAPYFWSVNSGSLPAGLSLQATNTNSVAIAGTPTALGTATFTLGVTDGGKLSGTSPALSITINQPLPLQITTTSLPNGTINIAYSASLQAVGGIQPYTWSVKSGALPAGLKLAANGTISGTPTTAGTSNFTVQVTDSATPTPGAATANLSISIAASTPLKGNFAFEFSGNDSSGLVVAAGSFVADGQGHITSGIEDFNTVGGRRFLAQSFTGSYMLGADNRGTLTFKTKNPSAVTYAFAIDPSQTHGRLIEFDSTGIRGSGEIEKQSTTTCGLSTLAANAEFAIGANGFAIASASAAGPLALAGEFTSDGNGNLQQGESDANFPGQANTPQSALSGTYSPGASPASCNLSMNTQGIIADLSAYPVSSSEFFVIETDAVSGTSPLLMLGKILQQFGTPFPISGDLTGTAVAGLVGQVFNGTSYVPDDFVAQFAATGNAFTLTLTENQDGAVVNNSNSPITGTFSSDQFGRITFSGNQSGFVMYVINTNQSFFLTIAPNTNGQPNPVFGEFDPQSSGPFSAATLKGTFVQGTLPPASLASSSNPTPDFSGVVTLDGVSKVTGTQDTSTTGGNAAAQSVTGTYSITSAANGSGAYTLTSPTGLTAFIYVVSPTNFVALTTTPGNLTPTIIVFGN